MIHTDRLIRDFAQVERWVKKRSGCFYNGNYARGRDHSTFVTFSGNFDSALEFLSLPGVRRAIIAYWTESLHQLQERQSVSVYARRHNWNAVAELKRRVQTGTL
jgi:hypothetical protein